MSHTSSHNNFPRRHCARPTLDTCLEKQRSKHKTSFCANSTLHFLTHCDPFKCTHDRGLAGMVHAWRYEEKEFLPSLDFCRGKQRSKHKTKLPCRFQALFFTHCYPFKCTLDRGLAGIVNAWRYEGKEFQHIDFKGHLAIPPHAVLWAFDGLF